MRITILLTLVSILFSCQKKNDETSIALLSNKKIRLDTLIVDRLIFQEVETSYTGFIRIINDSIHYFDRRFGWVFIFDTQGKLVTQKLGQGEGPWELNTAYVDGYARLKNGDHFFIGSSFDIHVHDKDYKRKFQYVLGWFGNQNIDKVREADVPDPSEFALYTLDYENLTLRADSKNYLYIPIYAENPRFNAFSSIRYYEEGKILAKLDLKTGKIEQVLGKRSPEYLKYKYLGHHATFYYDISDQDNFYISHEIDSVIYKYDNDLNLIGKFGFAGKSMDQNYKEVPEFDLRLLREAYGKDRPTRGYYHHLEYMDDQQLLFRSYTKGGSSELDGLQIYKDEILIADVEVPKGLIVRGYIAPYFYAESILENDENLLLYRFKIQN